ncbi:hypothetical protein [Rhizorhabdus phycosphaerae]|uniref:hypothetical protein n=1 Tax=Rhizorhabdus phycosphaerae TaxID=2711156 RepID=UPI0013ED303E|nr:hypothetical protein [Rhizorhabdus phycosphaerae]
MNEGRVYALSGIRLACGFEVPEWESFRVEPGAGEDVRIALAEAQPGLPATSCALAEGRDLWLVISGFATFHVEDGCRITVFPEPDVPLSQWRPFLLGTAWNALCLQRDILLLHASVVARDKNALAFCGPSGAGKSSMAASLLREGYSLVSDDLCRVDPSPVAQVHPSMPRLRLWREMLALGGAVPEELTPVLDGRDKFQLPVAGTGRAPVSLHAIFLLEWGEPEVRRICGLDALKRLVGEATYRPEMVEAMGLSGRHWQHCLTLLRTVPLYVLRRPRDIARLDAAPALIRQLTGDPRHTGM